ncbi:MAG: hypothetical protein ACE37F_34680 [Nannocystaceae bacterium]|nr:hypothetical protein [bacterium]
MIAFLPPPTGTQTNDPFAMLADSGGPLFILALLVPVAVVVFYLGSRRLAKERGTHALRPRGRVWFDAPRKRSERWRTTVRGLEGRDPSVASKATAGAVRLQGVLCGASENLGGAAGRECVWRNRAGASAASAVASETVFLRDDTGTVAIEDLEQAYVIAPAEKHTFHHENVSLYLGDRVEVYGQFTPEPAPADAGQPTERVYGTLALVDGLDIRLIDRPTPETADDGANEDAPSPEVDTAQP